MSNLFNAIILFVCIAIMVGAFVFTLDEMGLYLFGLKWPLHCLLNHFFGIKCALCGMTRSFTAIAGGDLAGAFAYHRLGAVLFFPHAQHDSGAELVRAARPGGAGFPAGTGRSAR